MNPTISEECRIFTKLKNEKFLINNIQYPKFIPLINDKSIDFKCLNSKNKKYNKTILFWNKFIGSPLEPIDFSSSNSKNVLEKCPVTNCELTNERLKLNKSDLVLFHLRNNINSFPLNQQRSLNQRWVHVIYESPNHCFYCDKHENVFNLSATYTKDSDFTSLYWLNSGIYWESNLNSTINNNISNKSELLFAASLISNCAAPSSRMDYIKELKNYIDIKIFGRCGIPCPEENCHEFISNNYKFFLVFENSICRDYVTEKFFNTLRYNIIPVVLGGGDYSYYVPNTSYINALDYKRPNDLADYLNYLNMNKTAYNEYFEWKKYIKINLNRPRMGFICEMCIKLNLEELTGVLQIKELKQVRKLYNKNENCNGTLFQNNSLHILAGDKLEQAYFSSPESWLN